jgi:putative transposon-encoded protein
MKIKITNKEKNITGTYKKKVVFPYGNSARIPEQKQNIGKRVYVIYPKNAYYSWVLSNDKLKILLTKARKNLKTFQTKHKKSYENAIESLESDKFNLNDIKFVLDLIEDEKVLYQEINKIYLK